MIDLVLINSAVLHRRVTGEAMRQVDLRAEAICKIGMSTEKRIKRSKVEKEKRTSFPFSYKRCLHA